MKKIFLICFALCSFVLLWAQNAGPISITSAECASISADQKATVAFQVTGTWTGTLQPKVAISGQAAADTQVTPPDSTTAQSTVTTNGAYVAHVSGYQLFEVCGATVASGTAKVWLNASPALH